MKSNWKASGRLLLRDLVGFWNSSNTMQRWLIVAAGVWVANVIVHILLLIKVICKALEFQ